MNKKASAWAGAHFRLVKAEDGRAAAIAVPPSTPRLLSRRLPSAQKVQVFKGR